LRERWNTRERKRKEGLGLEVQGKNEREEMFRAVWEIKKNEEKKKRGGGVSAEDVKYGEKRKC